jgi:hypothetical protein
MAIALLVSAVAGMILSTVYWRYIFAPPSWTPAVAGIASVEAAQLVGYEDAPRGVDAVRGVADCAEDALAAGLLGCELLKKRGLRVDDADLGRRTAREVLAQMERRKMLFDGVPGYPYARELRGLIVLAKGVDGNEYVLAALNGGQVSNDHYPQYHLLFRVDSGALRLVSSDRYFQDFAGIEGARWWTFAVVLAVFLVPGALLGVLIRRLTSGGTPSAFPSRSMNSHS